MKRRLLVGTVLFLLAGSLLLVANQLQSVFIPPNGMLQAPIQVPNDHVLKIHNFTQQGGTTRGVVTVTIKNMPTANVLTAAIIDSANAPEFVNQIVIAGPADVAATCGNADPAGGCVLSYRKEKTSSD